jgi:hypothetical protein
MAAAPKAIGVSLLLGYLIHYICYLLASFEKFGLKTEDVAERNKKLYLFGILGLLSVHFCSTWAAIFSWLTLCSLVLFYLTCFKSDEEQKKKTAAFGGFIYSVLLTFWWIGATVDIFDKVVFVSA